MSNNHHWDSKKVTVGSLLVALGIIYGDIGTSPLYVLKAIIGTKEITEQLVYGGISCVFWTLMLQTTFKYIYLTLQADNQGEGGIFSLYALVRRFGKKWSILAMIGATTLLADGIITPPISVASAVEGLSNVAGLETLFAPGSNVTILSVIAILSVLFFFQRFGTNKVGKAFGPIMVVWFSMLATLGVTQLIYHPEVLQAINPKYAYDLLVEYPQGFWLLGAVFLCTTGAEALYSDLGHCGRKNIRISWVFVKTALLLNYFGQSAWLLSSQNKYLEGQNPFYEIMPQWFLIPGIAIATLATIIASQALISGSYTLISEAMNLNFWPRVATRQPSEQKGQIYIPSVNTILWIGCIAMIVYFKSSEHMEAAYGFSITVTMLMTTLLLTVYLYYIRKWNHTFIFFLLGLFLIVELSFFVANVAKIKERWMFLFFELFIFLVMYIWFESRKINNKLTHFVDLGKYTTLISELSKDLSMPKFCTHLIYLTKADKRSEVEEKIIKSILSRKPKRADVYWLLHLNRTNQPYDLTYDVTELVPGILLKINIHIGFRISPKTELYFKKILQDLVAQGEIKLHHSPDGSTKYNKEPDFKFVVIKKFLSVENEFALKEGLFLSSYFFLKKLSQSDEAAFGLDKNDVVTEEFPLVYQQITNINLTKHIKDK